MMLNKNYLLVLSALFIICFTKTNNLCGQLPYYQIDGNNCDVNGFSPEWGEPYATDPDDESTGGADIKNFWTHYDTINQQYCFAIERFDDGGGPSSTYSVYFDVDCDLSDGGTGPQLGSEIAFSFIWGNGTQETVERFERGVNGSVDIGTCYIGQSICAEPTSEGAFAEFCIYLEDIIGVTNDGYYDPCACNSLTITGIASQAGGSFNSSPKDEVDFDNSVNKINETPIAVLESLPNEICLGDEILYSGINSFDTFPYTDESMDYLWDFDFDGINFEIMSTDTFGTYIYPSPGTFNIALIVVDTFDCQDTAFHTINVIQDILGPNIICPEDQELSADENCEASLPNYSDIIIVTDNCSNPDDINVTQSPPAGTIVTGITVVTLTAIDEVGNQENCSFDVAVIDDSIIGFTITCPANQEVSADENCEAVIGDYTGDVILMDNCSDPSAIIITQSPSIGTIISGTTAVTMTATDEAGNQVSCSFDVTVIDDSTVGFSILCPANQEVSADENCEAVLGDYTGDVKVMDNCSDPSAIIITQSPSIGTIISGTTAVTMTATDEAGNQVSCSFDVTVLDDSSVGLSILCPGNDQVSANENCEAVLLDYTGLAVASDNCSDPSDIVISQSPEPGTIISGFNVIFLTATDEAGNQVQCILVVEVIDNTNIGLDILCPPNQEVSADENCEAVLLDYTGLAVASDNCTDPSDIVISQNPEPGTIISGATTVTLTATDEAGNQSTCDLLVTVIDDSIIGLTIECPEYQNISADENCEAILLDYTDQAVVSDNCSDPTDIVITQTPAPGSVITAITEIKLVASDEAGNEVECSFIVEVVDDNTTGLEISCPDDQTYSADENCEAILLDYTNDAMVSDNCSLSEDLVVSQFPLPGTTIFGTTEVRLTVTDEAGNELSCVFNVSVEDDSNLGLTISCPENDQLTADENCEAILPDYTAEAIVSDNCSDPSNIIVTQNPAPGTLLSSGFSFIYLTATDEAGNQETCFLLVSVFDDSTNGLEIICPQEQDVLADENCEALIPDFTGDAIVMDNCTSPDNLVVTQNPLPGTLIYESTIITLTVTDIAGNQENCSFELSFVDGINPTIQCPSDLTVVADENCEIVIPDLSSQVSSTDNCTNPINIDITQSPLAGTIVTENTTIILSAEDEGGNISTCSTELIVDYCLAEICGNLYFDINGNGTQDLAEPGLPAVDVFITDSQGNIQTITTQVDPDGDLNGVWCVVVPPGDVTIDVDESDPEFLSGYIQTEGDDPTIITAIGGQLNDGGNDGYTIYGDVCGHLYMDLDGSGQQDNNEPDLANVDIIITDGNGVVQTVSSGADGNYCIQVPQGSIIVDIDESDPQYPTGSIQTEGDDPSIVIATYGQTVDAGNDGFSIYGEVCGLIYNDFNGNGQQDAGEPDMPFIDVIITDANGMQYTVTTQVDPDGSMNGVWCVNVPPGEITIDVDESDPNFLTGSTQTEGEDPNMVTAIAGQLIDGGTDGYSIFSTLCGHLYLDTDGNGTQNGSEPNLPNVDIIILDANGLSQTIFTDVNGDYCIDVPPGPITVDVDETDPDFPSGAIQTEGDDPTIVIAVLGQTIDAGNDGYSIYGTVCGLLYEDTNGNGQQDAGEPELPLVDVVITDENGTQYIATTQVDPDGDLNGLWCVSVPPGLITIDIDETDPDFITGSTQTEGDDPNTVLAIAGQEVDGGIDGFVLLGEICGHIYLDSNGNGTQENNEPDLKNIDVIITNSEGLTQTVNSNANGNYCAEVILGSVIVDIDETDPDFPMGTAQTEGDDPNTVIALFNQIVDAGTDGFSYNGEVCGHLYIDSNENGTQDIGEPDLPLVNIIISHEDGNIYTIETLVDPDGDLNGVWCAILPPGDITIDVDENDPDFPIGAIQTEGEDPTFATIVTGQLTAGGEDGYFVPPGVCGRVYLDSNGNGIMDPNEDGIPFVDVTIADESNVPFIVETDINGYYCAEVVAGSVFILVMEDDPDFPLGAVQSQGINPNFVIAIEGEYIDGGTDGYIVQSVTCGTIYFDNNSNGTQDPGEPGIIDVDVLVTDVLGNTQTVTTNSDGVWCATVPEGLTTILINESDPDYPLGSVQTEGDNPSFISTVDGQVTFGGNDGFQLCIVPQVKVFLEGSLLVLESDFEYGDEMRTSLNDLRLLPGQLRIDPFFGNIYFPPGHPYVSAPWNYSGTEGDNFDSQNIALNEDANYPSNAVDWVLVSLRTNEQKSSELCKAAGLLLKDGTVQLMDSFDCCGITEDEFYIVVEHRNHLIVMSPTKVLANGGIVNFDFTKNDSYKDFFGLGASQKQVQSMSGQAYFAMYGGNGDQQGSATADTDINVNDKVIWETENNQFAIYNSADFNLSGDINVNDKLLWQSNNNSFSSVPN